MRRFHVLLLCLSYIAGPSVAQTQQALSNELKTTIVAEHNQRRRNVKPAAADMNELVGEQLLWNVPRKRYAAINKNLMFQDNDACRLVWRSTRHKCVCVRVWHQGV